MVIPYVDINPKGNGYYCFKDRKFAISTFLFGFLVMWVGLIIIGRSSAARAGTSSCPGSTGTCTRRSRSPT